MAKAKKPRGETLSRIKCATRVEVEDAPVSGSFVYSTRQGGPARAGLELGQCAWETRSIALVLCPRRSAVRSRAADRARPRNGRSGGAAQARSCAGSQPRVIPRHLYSSFAEECAPAR